MEEETSAWEALDIDDSDFPSLLRPCKRHHHSSQPLTLIPGPAGALQAAMNRKSQLFQGPISTQEFLRKAVEDDFSLDPWLCALDFLRQEGLVDPRGLLLTMPLRLIGEGDDGIIERAPLVVAIIKSCTSNGLGDMMVTLKDPTGTVGASIHRTVLTDGDFGKDISAGAVLVLKQVAVLSFSRTANYLNITPSNVVKVISKVGGPPLKEKDNASTVKHKASASESRETSTTPYHLQGRTQYIMNGLRKDASMGEHSAQNEEPDSTMREGRTVALRSRANSDCNQEEVVVVQQQKTHWGCKFGSNNDQSADKPNKDGVEKALPQWTEEQLEELFTFDD